MALSFFDLDYRVRNLMTRNVVAAFHSSAAAEDYLAFLRSQPKTSRGSYEIETANINDVSGRYRYVDELTVVPF